MKNWIVALRWISAFLFVVFVGAMSPAFANAGQYPDHPVPEECLKQARKEGKLYIYNWAEWWPEELYMNFEKEYGIKIVMDNFSSAEQQVTKFKLNPSIGYDITTGGYIDFIRLQRLGILKELRHDWVPNVMAYSPSRYRNIPENPNLKYFAPDSMYMTGYAYNSNFIDETDPLMGSIRMIFESEQLKNRMTMLDDTWNAIASALQYLGYSANTVDENELMEAKELLRKQKALIVAYDADPKRLLIEQEVILSQVWSGDAYWLRDEIPGLKVFLPKEGTQLGLGMMLMPKGGKNTAAAHLFINYIFRPENSAMLIEGIGYAPCHTAVPDLLPEEMRNDPSIFPSEEYLKKCEMEHARSVTGKGHKLRAQVWEVLKR